VKGKILRKVNATDFKMHFGDFVDLVRNEPIEVLRGSKSVGVFVSPDEYEHLQCLDDAYWVARASAAEAQGRWIGHKEALRLLTDNFKRDA
jgi:PHD/YefM family antitoxin component YafN of YafNO toxin-antitoxin module